jgi:hypothetical protein
MGQTPPKGYTPIPGSKHNGYHKRVGKKFLRWYPDDLTHPEEWHLSDTHKPLHGEVPISRGELKQLLAHGTFSIVSAGRNSADPKEENLPETDPKFINRHAALRQDLEKAGVPFTEVEGFYGGHEISFVVYHEAIPSKTEGRKAFLVQHADKTGVGGDTEYAFIRELGARYNQDSVIHSRHGVSEVRYTTGANKDKFVSAYVNKATGRTYGFMKNPSEFYTKVPHDNTAPSTFSMNFDFDAKRPVEEATLKGGGIFEAMLDWVCKSLPPKPPEGYSPIPGSKHGGYHKHVGNVWRTWYPEGNFARKDTDTGSEVLHQSGTRYQLDETPDGATTLTTHMPGRHPSVSGHATLGDALDTVHVAGEQYRAIERIQRAYERHGNQTRYENDRAQNRVDFLDAISRPK